MGLKYLAFLSFIFFSLFSCQKADINGDLDGEWEVVSVTPSPPEWDQDLRIFYNFGHHVCQLTVYGAPFTEGNMVYSGDEMHLDFPFINSPKEILQLKQYGIFSNPVSFHVHFESKSKLILSNEESIVILKKF